MKDRLYHFYWALERRIVPGHTSSQYIYLRELKEFLPSAPIWLDLGCGHQLFAEWMTAEQLDMTRHSKQLVGIDLDHAGLVKHQGLRDKVEGSLESLPFLDGAFDLVTANMVVEHLPDPARILCEIRRVLKPGGLFIFHTPNYLNFKVFLASHTPRFIKRRLIRLLEDRREEDVFETCYQMNTPDRIRKLCSQTGFDLARLTLTDSSASTVLLGPIVIFELLLFKLNRLEALQNLRSNIIGVLRKPLTVKSPAESRCGD